MNENYCAHAFRYSRCEPVSEVLLTVLPADLVAPNCWIEPWAHPLGPLRFPPSTIENTDK